MISPPQFKRRASLSVINPFGVDIINNPAPLLSCHRGLTEVNILLPAVDIRLKYVILGVPS